MISLFSREQEQKDLWITKIRKDEGIFFTVTDNTRVFLIILQNSPYFLRTKVRASSQTKSLERDWGETLKIRTDRFAYRRYIPSNYPLLSATGNSHWLNFDASCKVMFTPNHSRSSQPAFAVNS